MMHAHFERCYSNRQQQQTMSVGCFVYQLTKGNIEALVYILDSKSLRSITSFKLSSFRPDGFRYSTMATLPFGFSRCGHPPPSTLHPPTLALRGRGKFNFAKYFQEKNPEPLVFAPFSKGIQEMDGGGGSRRIKPKKTIEKNKNTQVIRLYRFI